MSGLAHLAQGGPRAARSIMASRDPKSDSVDFFPTPPWGGRAGAELVLQLDPSARSVWECAAGAGHMAHGLRDYFPVVFESDAYDYGRGVPLFDFAAGPAHPAPWRPDWVVTNPPFALTERFIRLAYARAGRGVAMLMRLAMLEGQGRDRLFYDQVPLAASAPFAERLPMVKGRWEPEASSASAYAWFFWLKPAAGGARRWARGPSSGARLLRIPAGTRKRLERPSDRAFAAGDGL
jgi:hypothetical protein